LSAQPLWPRLQHVQRRLGARRHTGGAPTYPALRRPADELLNQWDLLVAAASAKEGAAPGVFSKLPEAWLRNVQRFKQLCGRISP
jgi:hypothetical protein